MIYTCQHCGASLPIELIRNAMKNKEPFIVCPYDGMPNEIAATRSSYTVKGFDFLAAGDFYQASYAFSTAIDDAKSHKHLPAIDAYLGYALAQFRVQTIFSDEDEARVEMPQLICHKCNEIYFSNSEAYLHARDSVVKEVSPEMQAEELAKLEVYAKHIDNIKDCYDGIKATNGNNFKYQVFIAYEDCSMDASNRGYEYANRLRNMLPDKIRNVFLPERELYASDEEYEAAILYALENSNCMLVITDNDIDSHLINLYSRFYFISRDQKKGGNNLGFVRYCGHITIALPDKTIAEKNVFDIDNTADYCNFALSKNGILLSSSPMIETNEIQRLGLEAEDFQQDAITDVDDFGNDKPYHPLPGKYIAFGHYPQKRVAQQDVEDFFAGFGKPSISNDKGWTPLSFTKKGNPHMWYRDEDFGGKRYRAIYFTKFRELYSVQQSDIPNDAQKKNHYLPMRIYCFEFQPLIWSIRTMTNDIAVLVAHHGIDCREFNNTNLDNHWETSSIHQWLNEDFVQTAFTEEERHYLGMLDSMTENDKIYLVDKSIDRDFYAGSRHAVRCSDYFKCIGGIGEYTVNSYWITAKIDMDDAEASVIYPSSKNGLATQYVDCCGVAVLPKIIIKLND